MRAGIPRLAKVEHIRSVKVMLPSRMLQADDRRPLRIAGLEVVGKIELAGHGVVRLDRGDHRRGIGQVIHAITAAAGQQRHLVVEGRVIVGLRHGERLPRLGGDLRPLGRRRGP